MFYPPTLFPPKNREEIHMLLIILIVDYLITPSRHHCRQRQDARTSVTARTPSRVSSHIQLCLGGGMPIDRVRGIRCTRSGGSGGSVWYYEVDNRSRCDRPQVGGHRWKHTKSPNSGLGDHRNRNRLERALSVIHKQLRNEMCDTLTTKDAYVWYNKL